MDGHASSPYSAGPGPPDRRTLRHLSTAHTMIATIAAPQPWIIALIDNTTTTGTWRA